MDKIEGSSLPFEPLKQDSSEKDLIETVAQTILGSQSSGDAHKISAEGQLPSLTKTSFVATAELGTVGIGLPEDLKIASQKMDVYLHSLEENAFFTGTVLVRQGDKTILCEGYGNAVEQKSNNPSTVFYIGSLTKQFTAAAILKLNLDPKTPVNECLPSEYRSPKWENVTLHNLLSHSSGIPNYTDAKDYESAFGELTVDKVLQNARSLELQFSPGSDHAYCNTGYLLLGKIIEHKSGKSYEQFVREEILNPAGLNSSGFANEESSKTIPIAQGHSLDEKGTSLKIENKNDLHVANADGSMYSTVGDLAKWSRILDGNTSVLSKKSVDLMEAPNLNRYGQGYGYGLMIDTSASNPKTIFHSGCVYGFKSEFCRYPEQDLLIVILSNSDASGLYGIRSNLAKILLEPEKPTASLLPFPQNFDFLPYLRSFEATEGPYVGARYSFKREGEHLMLVDLSNQFSGPAPCSLLSNGNLYSVGLGVEFTIDQKTGDLCLYDNAGTIDGVLKPID